MNAYIYKADLICETCGIKVKSELKEKGLAPKDPNNEYTYDSDDYPKGPISDGGGESDSPAHCGFCGLFLENPLTDEGMNFVTDNIIDAVDNDTMTDVLEEWASFYDINVDEDDEFEDDEEYAEEEV